MKLPLLWALAGFSGIVLQTYNSKKDEQLTRESGDQRAHRRIPEKHGHAAHH
jgi:hypothetical protein